jgi:hypothetical protein
MTVDEHLETALVFLEESQREFLAGDTLQGSEKLWGAVSHAVMPIALQRGWGCGSHYLLKSAIKRLSEERDDRSLRLAFGLAEKFHANFYHGFMQSYQLDEDIPLVREFVEQLVSMAQSFSKE